MSDPKDIQRAFADLRQAIYDLESTILAMLDRLTAVELRQGPPTTDWTE